MDKNNDFIRIDEVFRNMGDAEEPVKAGAWSDMRALLDKEMPLETTTTVGVKSRALRYALPALLLLLVGSGAYVWNNHQSASPTRMHLDASSKIANTTQASGGGLASNTTNAKPTTTTNVDAHLNAKPSVVSKTVATNEEAKPSGDIAAGQVNREPSNNNNNSDNNSSSNNNNNESKSSIIDGVDSKTIAHLDVSVEESTTMQKSPEARAVANQPVSKISTSELQEKEIQATSISVGSVVLPNNPVVLQSSLSEIRHEHAFEQIQPAPKQLSGEEPALAGKLAEEHHLEKVGQLNQQDVYQSENGGLYKEQRDTFKQIELAQRPSDRNYTKDLRKPFVPELDTVSVYKIARLSFVPLSIAEVSALSPAVLSANIQPMHLASSALASASPDLSGMTASTDLVPLKEFRVSSHKMNGSIFSKWFQYANGGMSGLFDGTKDWYISFLFGGNMGLGSPNAYGMQAGASFLYALAERWTLALEIRYQNSLYSNFRFFDNATIYDVTAEKTPLGTQFSGMEYKNQTNYQANSLSRISMPVLLSYNLGRVSVFAGPEFSYYFTLNNTHHETVDAAAVSKLTYDNKNPFTNEYYRLDPASDFKARFALGYAFGLSYDFSRKVSVDLRFNQMLWDNSGKYQLDALRQIYRQPMVELNFGFYLGRKDKVVYIMDRNR